MGAGLAGCEAAWQLARRGMHVALVEMKPARMSPAHSTPLCAELVCSNSLRSDEPTAPAGLLKAELRRLGSLILDCADATRVPAGEALAVDRHAFARRVTAAIALERRIRLERRTLDVLPPGPLVVAGGPLLAGGVARIVRAWAGDRLYFYDAIAPIVDGDTVDWRHAFRASRYDQGAAAGESDGDYVNCPLDRQEYVSFVEELRHGWKVAPHAFEEARYFEGCLPIEVIAERGEGALAFGPMRPVGLDDPRPGRRRPHAVVQLRAENRHATSFNLVGFQTRLAQPEQKRIFSLIPALRHAEFLRYGSIHRNSYIDTPRLLDEELRLRDRPDIRFAGQITGVEGYIESTATGLLVGGWVADRLAGRAPCLPPAETAVGALHQHLVRPRQTREPFSPSNIHYGLFPPGEARASKRERRARHTVRARLAFERWLGER